MQRVGKWSENRRRAIRRLAAGLLIGAAPLAASPAIAAVPSDVSYQGRLYDSDGNPLPGPVDIEVGVWDALAGGTRLYAEIHTNVPLHDGVFSILIGTGSLPQGAFGPALFSGANRWLEVVVEGETLSPRQPFSAVPYALRAAKSDDSVPAGAVMMFDRSACPEGWSELAAARGRTLVGLDAGGVLGATVGAALADREDRVHAHSASASDGITSTAGGHTHGYDPAAASSAAASADHTHSVNPPATNTDSYAHNHAWSTWNSAGRWGTFGASGSRFDLPVTWGNGIGNEGEGYAPLALPLPYPSETYYTGDDSHVHVVDIAAFTSGTSSTTLHSHTVDVPPGSTGDAGSHGHSVSVSGGVTSGASAGMPYLQLLTCRKD
jgi:hypothetical protein